MTRFRMTISTDLFLIKRSSLIRAAIVPPTNQSHMQIGDKIRNGDVIGTVIEIGERTMVRTSVNGSENQIDSINGKVKVQYNHPRTGRECIEWWYFKPVNRKRKS